MALAKELNDMAALGLALYWAGLLAHFERNTAEVERLALELIELCTRQAFASWLPGGVVLRHFVQSRMHAKTRRVGTSNSPGRSPAPVVFGWLFSVTATASFPRDWVRLVA
jgi:hypothetical protein